MLRMIKAELYRLSHKKSMYFYFTALAVGYFILAFIRSGGFDEQTIISDSFNFFMFLPPLVGGYLFACVYIDDLSSKSLSTLVGFGVGKIRIVLAKLLVMIIVTVGIYTAIPVFMCIVFTVLGQPPAIATLISVCCVAAKYLLISIAYSALSGISVYGWQRTTFAMVLYILLALNVISGFLTVVINKLLGSQLAVYVISRLMPSITDRIMLGLMGPVDLIIPVIEYGLYLMAAIIATIVAFDKKEMEF